MNGSPTPRRLALLRSIRTRLIAANIGIILLSTSLLTLIAGNQIAGSVRGDYEASLRSTIQLIARGLAPTVIAFRSGQIDETALAAACHDYEIQSGGTLSLFFTGTEGPAAANLSKYTLPPESLDQYPELAKAVHELSALVERRDRQGIEMLYTAASVHDQNRSVGLMQLAVPATALRALEAQRWTALTLGFLLLTGLALVATLWIARSIIRPLYILRDSANRLAEGQLSYRVPIERLDELGEVARAFNNMASQLQHTLDEQRAFTSNASHELRTPLTNIRLRTETLLYDPHLPTDMIRQYIAEIDQEAKTLTALIQELALLSRLEAGSLEPGHDQIDISRFAVSMCQQYSEEAAQKRITLAVLPPDEPILILTNVSHLTVIFRNLLENSLKYTSAGGRIDCIIRRANQQVMLSLVDTGLGVSPEDLPHIFERFYRADRARSKDIPGTGLGLSLVRSLLTLYAGKITIASAGIGQGTTATIHWPTIQPMHPI